MRDRLAAFILVLLAGCSASDSETTKEQQMSEIIVKGMKVTLNGPEQFMLSQVHPDSLAYDLAAKLYTVSFSNVANEDKRLPFDEISRNIGAVYRDPVSNAELSHHHPPPPKDDGATEIFSPGGTQSFRVNFEYPESIVAMKDGRALLQFCLKWEGSWLRAAAYKPDSFDWNESFELCQEVIILRDD